VKSLKIIVYEKLESFSGKLTKVLETVSALLILICFITLLFQVFYRFVIVKYFSFSFPFTEEFSRYLLVWTVYLIAGVNLREGSMVAINFVYDKLGKRSKAILYYITRVMILVFLSIVFIYSLRVIQQNLNYSSSTLRAPGWLLFSAPTVGVILLAFESIVEIIGVVFGINKPFESRLKA